MDSDRHFTVSNAHEVSVSKNQKKMIIHDGDIAFCFPRHLDESLILVVAFNAECKNSKKFSVHYQLLRLNLWLHGINTRDPSINNSMQALVAVDITVVGRR